MKKSNIAVILIIFILPLALYFFLRTPSESNSTKAFAGKNMPTVIKFYSTMCYDCKKLNAEMAPLVREYSGQIAFEPINISTRNQRVTSLMQKYSVNVVPTLIFIDKKGNFVRKTEGYMTRNQIRIYLEDVKNR